MNVGSLKPDDLEEIEKFSNIRWTRRARHLGFVTRMVRLMLVPQRILPIVHLSSPWVIAIREVDIGRPSLSMAGAEHKNYEW